jgi:hypothetical protein
MPSRRPAIALLALSLAACGGGAASKHDAQQTQDQAEQTAHKKPPPKTGPNMDGMITDAVVRSYTSTDVDDCGKVYTTAFIQAAYKSLAGCKAHMRQLAKLPQRTVRVISIKHDGPVADAKVRVDNFEQTVKLVLTGSQWQVDDTVGQQGSARQNLAASRQEAQDFGKVKTVAVGDAIAFKPVAGIGPKMNFSVTVTKIVANGFARGGVRGGNAGVANDFGTVANPNVKFRVVNVEIRVFNKGPAKFKGTFSGAVIGNGGKQWPNGTLVGRTPDWSDGDEKGLGSNGTETRWLSFAMPASGTPVTVELTPEVLSGPGTVAAVEPFKARWTVAG